MKLIVGLGNPGPKYQQTRHNVGFLVIDEVLKRLNITAKFDAKFNAEIAIAMISGEKACFMKPSTYMNLSGESIARVMKYYDIEINDLLVIVDDINLVTGKLRLREQGSHGGHNGLRSIIGLIHSEAFKRIRIGIDNQGPIPLDQYVLGKFSIDQQILIGHAIEHAADAVMSFVDHMPYKDIMTKYNTQT
jgi:peptidyl-tRNA hydrolase, PTH1 family